VKESLVRGSLQLLPLMGLRAPPKEPLRLRDFRLLLALELMRLRVYGLLPVLPLLEQLVACWNTGDSLKTGLLLKTHL
jgi:hypothetical protein